MARRKREWHTPRGEELPPYLIDIDTLARWLIIQCGKFIEFGNYSADNTIGSKTTRGDLVTLIGHDSGRIEHHWAYDN